MRAFLSWVGGWARDAAAAIARPASLPAFGERSVGAAFAHLAVLALVSWLLPFSAAFFVSAHGSIVAVDEGIRARVPAGAVFELKDGKFSTTLKDPLIVRERGFTLIVEAASGTADLSATETGIVIARDGVYQQDGLRRESVSFATAPPFRASKEELQAAFARWAPLALFVGASFALGIFFAVLLADFLLAAAFHAFALWLALKLWKRPHSWKRTFVVMAYAATGPLVLQALLVFAGTGLGQFSSLYYWGLTVWVLYAAVRTPSSGPKPTTPSDAS